MSNLHGFNQFALSKLLFFPQFISPGHSHQPVACDREASFSFLETIYLFSHNYAL